MNIEIIQANGAESIVLRMTREQLYLISSSVNEAIEVIEDWEFQTRLGFDKDEARRVGDELSDFASGLPHID